MKGYRVGAIRRPRANAALKTNNEAMVMDGRSSVQAGATESLLYLAKTHLALSNRAAVIDTFARFFTRPGLGSFLFRAVVS
jgi:hypothetical protein